MAITRSMFGYQPASLPVHMLPFPEGGDGETVCYRELSARDMRELRAAHGEGGGAGFTYDLLARSICLPDGTLLFKDAADLEQNFGLSMRTLKRLANEALDVNDIGGEEKNSPPKTATTTP